MTLRRWLTLEAKLEKLRSLIALCTNDVPRLCTFKAKGLKIEPAGAPDCETTNFTPREIAYFMVNDTIITISLLSQHVN